MHLIKCFVVSVTLFGTICLSKVVIEKHQSDELAELEEAAIQTLTTCYANHTKTIVLVGHFSRNFIKRLSAHQSFSLILLDYSRRSKTYSKIWSGREIEEETRYNRDIRRNKKHKVDVVVIASIKFSRFMKLLLTYRASSYNTNNPFVLVLSWSPIKKYALCDGDIETGRFLYYTQKVDALNVNLICRHRTKGTVLYTSNPFTNKAPEPWQQVKSLKYKGKHAIFYFVRKYRENEGMCKNLNFDKTHDLSGSEIEFLRFEFKSQRNIKMTLDKNDIKSRRMFTSSLIQDYFRVFMTYVNATMKIVVMRIETSNVIIPGYQNKIQLGYNMLEGVAEVVETCTYPYERKCSFIITQFRGNKSQLSKIFSVIDDYSWIGMYIVYIITLIFFKYFLRQPLIVGILNIIRLTSNFGLTTLPPNIASRIYLGCLLFFVVTMQGIFVGNLASLLTHNIPVRQVNSVQDLANLGYKVYVPPTYSVLFNDPVFEGRLIMRVNGDDCIKFILDDPLVACVSISSVEQAYALVSDLHVGSHCITEHFLVVSVPPHWPLLATLNNFLGIMIAADTIVPFHDMVEQKWLVEADSEEAPDEPEVMTMAHLGFAFVILGVGLGCAVISFIVEIMIYRYRRRVRRTRVIVI